MHPGFSCSSTHLKMVVFRQGQARPCHPRLSCFSAAKTGMPGTRPGMTSFSRKAIHGLHFAARLLGDIWRNTAFLEIKVSGPRTEIPAGRLYQGRTLTFSL